MKIYGIASVLITLGIHGAASAETCLDSKFEPALVGDGPFVDLRYNEGDQFGFKKVRSFSSISNVGFTGYDTNPGDTGQRAVVHDLALQLMQKTESIYDGCSQFNYYEWKNGNSDYLIVATAEDDCDGGNTLGLVLRTSSPQAVVGYIGDSDMSCATKGSAQVEGVTDLIGAISEAAHGLYEVEEIVQILSASAAPVPVLDGVPETADHFKIKFRAQIAVNECELNSLRSRYAEQLAFEDDEFSTHLNIKGIQATFDERRDQCGEVYNPQYVEFDQSFHKRFTVTVKNVGSANKDLTFAYPGVLLP